MSFEPHAKDFFINAETELVSGLGRRETIVIANQIYAIQFDQATSTVAYLGEAVPGTATSSAVWRVRRITETGDDVAVEFADGDADFDNVWDNRASLSYS